VSAIDQQNPTATAHLIRDREVELGGFSVSVADTKEVR
jgi:hypothetical protein